MSPQTQTAVKRKWLAVSFLTITAAILYCSWPLGYFLNPVVGTKGLASELEAIHQPYDWLFILLDVLSGLFVVIAAWIMWRVVVRRGLWLRAVLISYGIFGLGTLVDALLPMHCDPSLRVCPSVWDDPLLIAHGIASIMAAVFLFISVVLVWYRHHNLGQSILMTLMLGAWTLFGVASFVFFFVPGPGNLSQHYFITLCSVWVIIFPYTIGRPARKHKELFKQI